MSVVQTDTGRESNQLARFMREDVNIPFSFALLELGGKARPRRVHHAAVVLHDAAQDLVQWSDPPVDSPTARTVFYTYAQSLADHVGRLELAARNHDGGETARNLQNIRRTCNDCHRFFRPASRISPDVGYGRLAIQLGGDR